MTDDAVFDYDVDSSRGIDETDIQNGTRNLFYSSPAFATFVNYIELNGKSVLIVVDDGTGYSAIPGFKANEAQTWDAQAWAHFFETDYPEGWQAYDYVIHIPTTAIDGSYFDHDPDIRVSFEMALAHETG